MNSRMTHDRGSIGAAFRADHESVGVRPSRERHHAVDVRGVDGAVTRIFALPDGSIEIYTDGLASGGRAVRVPPTGPTRIIDC